MSALVEEEEEAQWSDWEDDEDPARALTDATLHPGVAAALAHDAARGFDLAAAVRELGVDFYGAVRLVNYVRAQAAQPGFTVDGLCAALRAPGAAWRGDEFLKPFLENDAVLCALDEIVADEAAGGAPAVRQQLAAAAADLRSLGAAVFDAMGSGYVPAHKVEALRLAVAAVGEAQVNGLLASATLAEDKETAALQAELSDVRAKLSALASQAQTILDKAS
ncbi:hypothetical protein M885DRAFT_510921 [Pelagophyceae sp. CCMP2097]|nr:hypothetical protein M885DRAFT_510921 [Pelagophyceae sp. CCMP2097]